MAGLEHVLRPESVVVVGGSRRRGTVGGELLHNIVAGGFTGALHVVHPRARSLEGVPAVPSAAELPPGVDLAVIAVAAPAVPGVVRECLAVGVRAVVVISAGFAEEGARGRRRQDAVRDLCREAGVRLVGRTASASSRPIRRCA